MSKVGIVGGGPAGLALAHDLARAGHDCTVFEAAPELGGLARSFHFGDLRIERYYHFLCADDRGYFRKLGELGIAGRLRWRATRMGFFCRQRLYPFNSVRDLLRFDPLSFFDRLRYGLFALYCSRLERWRRLDGLAAEPWLIGRLGRKAYLATWYPLLSVKFHRLHDQISAAWVWHRVHRVARSRKTPLHRERMGHLEGGTDTLIDALVADLERRGVALRPGCAVERIVIEGGRATGVETAGGERLAFDQVVAAVPLPLFLRLAPGLPEEYRRGLEAIDFLGVVCVILRLKRSLTPSFWLNVDDPRVSFNGVIEYTNLNPEMTPDGSSILYVPYYVRHDHPLFGRDDATVLADTLRGLCVLVPGFDAGWVIAGEVSRDRHAQVVCTVGFADRVPGHRTPVDGLYLIESSQLYPSDRTISGTIDLASAVARLIDPAIAVA